MNEHFKFLGKQVRDKVTGFTGTATSLCFDLYGCVQTVLTPPLDKDGNTRDGKWFDNNRLEIISEVVIMPVPSFIVDMNVRPMSERGPARKPEFDATPLR